ncbi:MAG: hypothetical protein LBU32_26165 [Clostridiales bacterium]|nr:hypothetical protein [Clostridiales bacterium]
MPRITKYVEKRLGDSVDKFVPRTEVAGEAEEIARMRETLTSGRPATIDPSGTITLPDSSAAPNPNDKIVPPAVVANEADEINRMRNLLTSGEDAIIDPSGTIKDSASEAGANDKVVPPTVVATVVFSEEAEIDRVRDTLENGANAVVDPSGSVASQDSPAIPSEKIVPPTIVS